MAENVRNTAMQTCAISISGTLEIVSIDSALRFSSYRAKVDRLDEYNASDQR